ncbi:MAG TPA: ABC transporter ATP-binding protein [Humisphaera sp.]
MTAVDVEHLTHAYGDRTALADLSLRVGAGEVFGLLGPNGSGKTTLFRILSTIVPTSPGMARVFGLDVATDRDAVRRPIGVVFQSAALDKHLTARENLTYHGHLYGLAGADLKARVTDALAAFGLAERSDDKVGTFSGGMRRRVEVAKGLLHRPRLLLMDEPSTGLDPVARADLWDAIVRVSRRDGVTALVTTHLMEEAERCDRLTILAGGKLLACDTPDALKGRIGGDVITMASRKPDDLAAALRDRAGVEPQVVEGVVRLERADGHRLVPQLIEAAPGLVDSVSVGKPTLQDVFIRLAGKSMAADASEAEPERPKRGRR